MDSIQPESSAVALPPCKKNFPEFFSEKILLDFAAYADVSKRSLDTYVKGIRAFLSYVQEHGIKNPGREDVIGFRESLRQTCKPTTIQVYLAGLRRFFSWLSIRGFWANICLGVKGVKLDKGFKKDCLTAKQSKELLAAIDTSNLQGKRDYALLALMLTTGLRDVEVARVKVEDVRVVGEYSVLFVHGKGRSEKAEYVKLAAPVEAALRTWLFERGDVSGSSPLFCSLSNHARNAVLTTRSISRIVKTRLQAIGVDSDRLTAHSLRHTAGTLNLLAGGTLQETQQLLRHASIVTTQIYAHNLERLKNQSENRISEQIFGHD